MYCPSMKNLARFACLTGLVLLAAAAAGLESSDLSPAAQSLLPGKDMVTLHLTDGTTVTGARVSEDDEAVMLEETYRNIKSQTLYKRDKIARVETLDVDSYFADGLLKRFFMPQEKAYTLTQYDNIIAVFEEFMDKCEYHPQAPEVKKHLEYWKQEKANTERGMEKIEGVWMAPVRAAVWKFNMYTRSLEGARERFSGIENRTFSGDPKARAYYVRMEQARREVARGLPRLMKQRLPKLIAEQRWDEAVSEVDAFQGFWMDQVVESEREGTNVGVEQILAGMDIGYIPTMQHQIMDAYMAAGMGKDTQEVGPGNEGMVYIPGGSMLRGGENASPGQVVFPLRIV